jgi:hypothetical protein
MSPTDLDETTIPISERTPVTLGLVLTLGTIAVTVAFSVFQGNANSKEIETLKAKQDSVVEMKADIKWIKESIRELKERKK